MATVTSRGFGSTLTGALHQAQQGLHMQSHHGYTTQPPAAPYNQGPPPGYPAQQAAPPSYPPQSQQHVHFQPQPQPQQTTYPLQQPAHPQQASPTLQHSHAGKQLVLASAQHVYPHAVDLVLREKYGLGRNDDFSIMDARTGAAMFRLDARLLSFSDKRALLDAYGRPVVQMQKKLLSLHGTWLINTPAGVRIADVKPSLMSFPTPSFKVYFNDGDDTPDLIATGNFRARSFTISHKPRGGHERVVATVKKESRFAGVESFFRNSMLDAQSYLLHVEPGVDVAFMAALATLIDEMFHDAK